MGIENIELSNPDSAFEKKYRSRHVLDEIKDRNDILRDYPHKENLVHFFQEKGQNFTFPLSFFPRDHALLIIEGMELNQCHWNTLMAYKKLGEKPNIHVCYGYVDGHTQTYNSQNYIQTVQHSFLIVENETPTGIESVIYDPTLALLNLRRSEETLTVFKNYFGVKLTRSFLEKHLIDLTKDHIITNVSWYLKEKIFPCREKTNEVLELL